MRRVGDPSAIHAVILASLDEKGTGSVRRAEPSDARRGSWLSSVSPISRTEPGWRRRERCRPDPGISHSENGAYRQPGRQIPKQSPRTERLSPAACDQGTGSTAFSSAAARIRFSTSTRSETGPTTSKVTSPSTPGADNSITTFYVRSASEQSRSGRSRRPTNAASSAAAPVASRRGRSRRSERPKEAFRLARAAAAGQSPSAGFSGARIAARTRTTSPGSGLRRLRAEQPRPRIGDRLQQETRRIDAAPGDCDRHVVVVADGDPAAVRCGQGQQRLR